MDTLQRVHREGREESTLGKRVALITTQEGHSTLIEVKEPCWMIELPFPGGKIGLVPCLYQDEEEAAEDADFMGGSVVQIEGGELWPRDSNS